MMTKEEFNEFLLKAEAGDRDAQNKVAFAYGAGNPIAKNLEECFKWHLKAAEQGQLNSMTNVGGYCYLYGNGTEKNLEKAVYWMQKAVDAGANDDWSKKAYACALNDRACELPDSMDKFQMFLKSAELGNMYGQNNVANAYANKKYGVEKDLTKAFEWYVKSAEQGNLNSIMNVGGWCYLWGNGTTVDSEKALYWMEKAIALGANDDWSLNAYALAQNNYGWDLYSGQKNWNSVEQSRIDKVVELFQKSADSGRCCYAIANLGNCYQTGQGVTKDLHKAKELYDKSLAAGLPHNEVIDRWLKELDEELAKEASTSAGAFSMGNSGSAFGDISVVPAFERQRREEEARRKAEEEARQKAEEEEARRKAEEEARRKAEEEEARRKAEEQARKEAEEAPRREFERLLALAEQGDAEAQREVAKAYVDALGVEKNLKKAFEWYLASAKQGNPRAMANVGGFCYLYGNGTDENNELAVYWLKKAWEAGYQTEWARSQYGAALYYRGEDFIDAADKTKERFMEYRERLNQNGMACSRSDINAYNEKIRDLYAKSFQLRLESAEYSSMAYEWLAKRYRNGWENVVERNLFKAKEWADKAFEANDCDQLKGIWMTSLEDELKKESLLNDYHDFLRQAGRSDLIGY